MSSPGAGPRPLTRTLAELAHVLESGAQSEGRLRAALELLGQLVSYDQCALLQVTEAGRRFTMHPAMERADAARVRAALEHMLGLLDQPIPPERGTAEIAPALSAAGWPAHLVVPLVAQDRLLGLLAVGRRTPEDYGEEELGLLAIVAAQLAAYIGGLAAAVAELRAREAQFRLLADNATDIIARLSLEGAYRYVSPACQALLGYSPDELVGQASQELVHPADLPAVRAVHRALLQEGAVATTAAYRHRRKDGTYLWLETTSRVVRDAQTGAVVEVQSASRDITARKQAQDALQEANAELARANARLEQASRAKSAFLATMSHEMRTPLNGVIGLTSLLHLTPLNPTQREYVAALQVSGAALLALINDILDFSKIEAGGLTLEAQPFDLRDLVGEVVALFAAQARAKGLELRAHVGAALPAALVGDAGRLRQVVVNLVDNALKFTAQGAVGVTVVLAGEDARGALVRVEVRDTGIGIAPAVQERLFEPFTQADASTTRQYGGTGLGLAIAKRLVEAMGGEIGVASAEGQGSTFWFTVCLAPGEAPAARVAARAAGAAPAAPRGRILVAEDNPISRLVAVDLLQSLGYAVEAAEDGRQAVEAMQRTQYDLVLMDLHMPALDGFAATATIRERERAEGRHVPIVALTADALAGDADKSVAAGMDDYLSKPVTRERLTAVLERWVKPGAASG